MGSERATPPKHDLPKGSRLRWLARGGRFVTGGTLPRRFLIVSFLVVACAMGAVGAIASWIVRDSIVQGVVAVSASSVDALISNSVGRLSLDGPLTEQDRTELDEFFEVSSSREATRLIQVLILRLDGTVFYEALEGVVDPGQAQMFERARGRVVTSDIIDLQLEDSGPLASYPLTLLRIYTPLHRAEDGEVIAVAALYFSARSIVEIQRWAEVGVWAAVLAIGLLVVAGLYAFVSLTNQTIQRQRERLATNLQESRALADEVRTLNVKSERMRLDAIEANEQLLARVGSDIHDGPLQLLTLTVLQLTRTKSGEPPAGNLQSSADLVRDATSDLRNISSGLVLPELARLSLEQTIELAVSRHEAATGTSVSRQLDDLGQSSEAAVKTCAYRVVQESLNDAYRHSGGLEQAVVAGPGDGFVNIEISNRLLTAAVEEKDARPKLGLRGMQLRAEAIGGGLFVEMARERMVVRLRVPVAAARSDNRP